MKEKDIDELAKSVGVIVEKILKLMLSDKSDDAVQQKNSVEE